MIFTRKEREPESAKDRHERMEREARALSERTSAEGRALDAAVRRSIEIHGP